MNITAFRIMGILIFMTAGIVLTGTALEWLAFSIKFLLHNSFTSISVFHSFPQPIGGVNALFFAGCAFGILSSQPDDRGSHRKRKGSRGAMLRNLPGMAYRCLHNSDWTMEYVSEGCLELTGLSCDDFIVTRSRSYESLIHPDDREMVRQTVSDAVARGVIFELRYRIITASGDEKYVDERGAGVYDENDDLIYLEGFISDATAKHRMEQQLRETNQLVHAVFHASPLAIVALDRNAHVIMWNASAERLLGWTAEEVISKPYPALPDEDVETFDQYYQRIVEENAFTNSHRKRKRKDGSLIDVFVHTAPIYDQAGETIGIVAILEDLSDKQRMEEEKQSLKEQLLQAQKMEALGLLAGGVAHDFNNLLMVIDGYSEMALTKIQAGDALYHDLIEIKKASERAAVITRQLLTFSRKQVSQTTTLSLNDVVSGTIKMLRRLIGEGITIHTLLDPGIGPVKADLGQIEQVIMNLAVNARDAMPKGGSLLLETVSEWITEPAPERGFPISPGRYEILIVTDTGHGMSKEVAQRVFEPFYTTKARGKGTGLGLSTVYGIIQQNNASITLASEPGKGTTFKLYFPSAERNDSISTNETSDRVAGGAETILLVEDDETVRTITRRLMRDKGYKVIEASNGKEAMRMLRQHESTIDLLMTDVVMPVMNGVDLARRIREQRPGVKVVFISGYTDYHLELFNAAGDLGPLLIKPFSPSKLYRAIRKALDGS
ncbi:MAG: PAS domain S-box protein [bacterium]|nr:PAS domain S-box protein [bacterium]